MRIRTRSNSYLRNKPSFIILYSTRRSSCSCQPESSKRIPRRGKRSRYPDCAWVEWCWATVFTRWICMPHIQKVDYSK